MRSKTNCSCVTRVWFFAAIFVVAALVPHVASGASPPAAQDRFGGFADIEATATGWFRIEAINGRDVLVTPDGHPFVALGINHVGAVRQHGDEEPDIFTEKYDRDLKRLQVAVRQQYAEWRFNTIDFAPAELRQGLPYTAAITLARTAKYFSPPDGEAFFPFPDVFDPNVQKQFERRVRQFCASHRGDPWLIGYCWTDTPTWDLQKTRRFRGTDWVSSIRGLGQDAPGKRRYVGFLRSQYQDDVARFNRAYGLLVASFDALLGERFTGLDLDRYDVARDDERFLGIIATEYYGTVGPATRDADPNHLVFGEKYLLGDHPDQVLKAAMPYIDVLSVQRGDGYIPIYVPGDIFPEAEIDRLAERTAKPVFICDHQISFATQRYPKAIWPYHQRPDEADAARATEEFIRQAFRKPYIIGNARCQYIDRYSLRRGAVKLGLVRDDGTPYELLVRHTKAANEAALATVRRDLDR